MRVAEAGSFTAVADELQVARSVVTRHIAALERHLHAKLMVRSTRSLSLTPAGAAYLAQCRQILELVEAAEAGLAEDRALRGRIRLGLPLTFGLRRLMPAITEFARLHPNVDLELNFADQRSRLVEEGIDLSVRITADLQPSDIVRRLGSCRVLTLASPAYLADRGRPRVPADLAKHDCLMYSMDPNGSHWAFGEGDKAKLQPVRPRLLANNGTALMQACAQGLGVCRQPDFIAAPYLASRQVVEVLHAFEAPPLGIFAVLPSNRYIPGRVSALIEHIEKAVGGG